MFFCFKYLLLILSFNQCFGASHLIPMAVYSPPAVRHPNRHYMGSGPMNADAASYYPVYALPLGNNPSYGELQYSASYAQPSVESLNGPKVKMVNVNVNSGQKQNSSQKSAYDIPIMEVQRPGPVESFKIPNIKYAPKRVNQREQPPVQNRAVQQLSVNNANQKSLIPMLLNTKISATTLTPMLSNYQINANSRSVSTKARKIKLSPEINARVESIRFNWPKTGQQNVSHNQQILYEEREIPQERKITRSQPQPQPLTSDQTNYETFQRQRYGESKNSFKYEHSYDNSDVTHMPTIETDINRETTTPFTTTEQTTERTTEPTTVMTTPAIKEEEEINNSDKKDKLSSTDSLLSYQTQYFEFEKPSKQAYDQNDQNIEHVHLLTNPMANNADSAPIPENEVSYSQAEPEPESEPELLREQYSDDDKELYDRSVDNNSGPELKTLLEQFIQQLDLLKFVATKQLNKNKEQIQPEYKSISEVMQTDDQPLTFGTKNTNNYDEYQTGRSFEQNLSNSDKKSYKDTDERTGRKYPCKKPFHTGALPNLGMPNQSNNRF